MELVQQRGEVMLFGSVDDERSSKVLGVERFFLEIGNAQNLPFETTATHTNEQLA